MFRKFLSTLFLSTGVLFFVAGGTSIVQKDAVAQFWGHTDTICAWAHEGNRTWACKAVHHCIQTSNLPAPHVGNWRDDVREERYQDCFEFNNADCVEVEDETQPCLHYDVYDVAGCHPDDLVASFTQEAPRCQ